MNTYYQTLYKVKKQKVRPERCKHSFISYAVEHYT